MVEEISGGIRQPRSAIERRAVATNGTWLRPVLLQLLAKIRPNRSVPSRTLASRLEVSMCNRASMLDAG